MKDDCPWSESVDEVVKRHASSAEAGLSNMEVRHRLHHHGPNELQTSSGRGWFGILIAQFKSLLVLLLATAAGLAFAFQDWIEGIAICAVLVINAVIGFLKLLREDYKKELKQLIQNNKSDPRINELVAKNFRLKMAINTIKNSKEVKDAA